MNKKGFFSLKKKEEERAPAESYDVAVTSMPAGRPVNEDYIGHATDQNRILFALADGLGGHGKGDEASKLAVETSIEVFNQGGELPGLLETMFQQAQDNVMHRQEETHSSSAMKTTLSLLLLEGDNAWYGHIGDSRIYFFNNRRYDFRTLDHSVPQMLVASGQIKDKDIRGHEDRNRLLRVIGIEWNEPRYDVVQECRKILCNDALLLCSDGFWELVTERQMQTALANAASAQEWLQQMEHCVLSAGKNKHMDNYSAIAIIAK